MQKILTTLRPAVTCTCDAVCVFTAICFEKVYRPSKSVEILLNEREFENTFKDSGYWDSFLLVIFDRFLRSVVIFSLSSVSANGIFEKASHLVHRSVMFVAPLMMPVTNAQLSEIFVSIGCAIIAVVAVCVSGGFCFYF